MARRKFLKNLFVVAVAWELLFSTNSRLPQRFIDPLLETPNEVNLEQRIRKEVYPSGFRGAGRQEKLDRFAGVYERARSNWDRFDEQFAEVNALFLKYDDTHCYVTVFDDIILGFGGEKELIHEMAHIWHFNRAWEMNAEWRLISEDHYLSDFINATDEDRTRNGAVYCYALKNIQEDVACTAQFVYEMCDPSVWVMNMPNRAMEGRRKDADLELLVFRRITNIPKVLAKTELLFKYGFISERERDYAMSELSAKGIDF